RIAELNALLAKIPADGGASNGQGYQAQIDEIQRIHFNVESAMDAHVTVHGVYDTDLQSSYRQLLEDIEYAEDSVAFASQ
ncbi:hypothetical protein COB11_07510, partial [Candidatus Aerophobetes bacterium]